MVRSEYRKIVLERKRQNYQSNKTFKKGALLNANRKYDTCKGEVLKNRRVKYSTSLQHRNRLKKASIEKYRKNPLHRQAVKNASTRKYKSDSNHREAVKAKNSKRYKTNNEFRTRKKTV